MFIWSGTVEVHKPKFMTWVSGVVLKGNEDLMNFEGILSGPTALFISSFEIA